MSPSKSLLSDELRESFLGQIGREANDAALADEIDRKPCWLTADAAEHIVWAAMHSGLPQLLCAAVKHCGNDFCAWDRPAYVQYMLDHPTFGRAPVGETTPYRALFQRGV